MNRKKNILRNLQINGKNQQLFCNLILNTNVSLYNNYVLILNKKYNQLKKKICRSYKNLRLYFNLNKNKEQYYIFLMINMLLFKKYNNISNKMI